jgi:nucleoside phosphorylase
MNIKLQNYFDVLDDNYVLICTSNIVEKNAINKIINHRCELVSDMNTLGCSIGLINNKFVVHLTGECGVESDISISRLVVEYIARDKNPKPSLVILSGFCWGNPEKTSVENVIVSSDIISLNSDSYHQDKKNYKATPYASSINARFIESKVNNVVSGTIGSLESLIASTSKRDEILTIYPHLLGGEMEAFGFVPSLRAIPWVIAKAISDFANDDFDREKQITAANRAACVVKEMLTLYESEGHLNLNSTTSQNLCLTHALYGKEIKITTKEVNSSNLNDFIDSLSPLVQYKLSYYLTGDEYGDDFIKYFGYLILETAQNSFKHGGATTCLIHFDEKSIFIQDDGNDFKLNDLESTEGRGGAFSWSKFKKYFLDTGYVKYKFEKKKHKFKLVKANENITRIINECTASIVANAIGGGWENSQVLSYDEGCEAVYVDDRQVFIPSRRFSLISEVQRIIESGRVVFVSVSDSENGAMYQSLGYGLDKLKIMVHK